MTMIPATTGKAIANTDSAIAIANSMVDTTGLVNPPETPVEVSRKIFINTLVNPALPPPAIKANVHCTKGFISGATDAATIVPAINAAGVATVSSR